MNQSRIKISVIMACFNSSKYLDEAISSVLNQTLKDFELILIDDASKDNTLELAKHYKMKDERVIVIPLPVNSGQANARNVGIRIAKGEWLGILDSDDVALPSRFEEQLGFAEKKRDLVLIGSNSVSINGRGKILREHRYPTEHRKLVKRLVFKQAFPPHSSMIYRRDAVHKLSGFNIKFSSSEDYDLWLRLAEKGEIASLGKCLVKIRKHTDNISNLDDGMLQVRFSFAASVCHFLRTNGYPDPSSSKDESAWNNYLLWIDRRLVEEGIFEKLKAWALARAVYFEKESRLSRTVYFGSHLLKSGYAGTILWEKFSGSSLPKSLALEWIKRSREAS